jgi:hypothetical protein
MEMKMKILCDTRVFLYGEYGHKSALPPISI